MTRIRTMLTAVTSRSDDPRECLGPWAACFYLVSFVIGREEFVPASLLVGTRSSLSSVLCSFFVFVVVVVVVVVVVW